MSGEFNNLKVFIKDEKENIQEFIEFFEKHGQYWKKNVFLEFLQFYHETADVVADIVFEKLKLEKIKNEKR